MRMGTPFFLESGTTVELLVTHSHHQTLSVVTNFCHLKDLTACSKKQLLEGFNDLATTHPELLTEWDYLNNLLLLNPKKIISNSRKNAWWICQKNPEHRYISNKIMHVKREKAPCLFCKGLRRKKEHFVQFEK